MGGGVVVSDEVINENSRGADKCDSQRSQWEREKGNRLC